MEVSRGSRLPLPGAHCPDWRPAPNSHPERRGRGGGKGARRLPLVA